MSLQDDYFELNEHEGLSANHKKALKRIWNAFCDMENQQDDLLDIKRSFKIIIKLCLEDEINSLISEFNNHTTQIEKLTKQLSKLEIDMNIEKVKNLKTKKPTKRKK